MATVFESDKKKAAGEMAQFAPPRRAASLLAGQINPTNAALVNNGRSPAGQPGPVSPAPANTALNLSLPSNPSTMIQGPDGVTAPGQAYTGRNLVPTGPVRSVSDSRALVPVDAGRSFTPPTGGAYDPNTIRQGMNTSAPSNIATLGGRELVLTGDAGRAFTSMGRPANPSFADNGRSIQGDLVREQMFARSNPEALRSTADTALPPTSAGWRGTASNVIKNLGLGAVGFGAARMMDNMGNNAPDTGPETRANVNAIPTGGNAPAPAAGQPTGWWDTNTGRNVGNTLNAMTPMLGPVSGAFRAGSNVSRLANTGSAVIGGMAAGATSPQAPYAAPATASTAGAGRDTVNPTIASLSTMPPAAPPAPANPNQITATRQPNGTMSFSGGPNIGKDGGEISYTGNAGFKSSGFGVTVVPGGSFANGSPAGDSALAAARMAAADRGDFGAVRDSYFAQGQGFAGQTRDSVAADRLKEIALSPQGTPGRKAAIQMLSDQTAATTARQGQEATNSIARKRLEMDQTAAGFTNRSAARIEGLYTAYEAANPEDRPAIAEQLRVFTGKEKPDEWKAIALQGGTDALGNKTEGVLAAVNGRTGEAKRLDGSQPAQAMPPGLVVGAPTKQADGSYPVGNKTVTIKAGKVTEIK